MDISIERNGEFADTIRLALETANISPREGGEQNEHYDISFTAAYLLGVPKRYFEEHSPSLIDIFNKCDQEKRAKIVRSLCSLRNAVENNFMRICRAINQEYKSIMTVPEYISQEDIMWLSNNGIDLYRCRKDPNQFIFELNKEIKNRINNCRDLFPKWLNWNYLSNIFVMPNGLTEWGIKAAAAEYYENKSCYPYGVYMNWPAEECGNILRTDRKFVTQLYRWNDDELRDLSLVSDVSEKTKSSIYDFIEKSDKTVFVVDCENSDPYMLCAAIRALDNEKLSRIQKIVLYDDVHAATGWDILKDYVNIPIEYILIERLKDNKSLADIKISARICKEHYENGVDSIVLVSSDSDYWGLIEGVPNINYLVMVEHAKFSYAMKRALLSKDIFYCYIDDFYKGGENEIKEKAISREIMRCLKSKVKLNVNDLLEEVLLRTRANMQVSEEQQYIKKYLRNLRVVVNNDGDVELSICV